MHPNPVFHSSDHAKDIAFARQRGFGLLTANGDPVPMVAHVPFLLAEDGTSADLHLVRSNPIARAAKKPIEAALIVSGPDSYISPDWYDIPDQVPTWNYVSVQLRGRLHPVEPGELRAMLDLQSASFEERLAPKPVWQTAKMTDEALERLMRMILPFRFETASIAATWKLGQNKPDAARISAAGALEEANLGSQLAQLAQLMKTPPEL